MLDCMRGLQDCTLEMWVMRANMQETLVQSRLGIYWVILDCTLFLDCVPWKETNLLPLILRTVFFQKAWKVHRKVSSGNRKE